MEVDVRIELPLWRWQAVKRKIKELKKLNADEATRLAELRLPWGMEAEPIVLRQAYVLRKRLPEVLRLHSALLELQTLIRKRTGVEELARGLRDMAYEMDSIARWQIRPYWASGQRRRGQKSCLYYSSASKLVLESERSQNAPLVTLDEAPRVVAAGIELETTRNLGLEPTPEQVAAWVPRQILPSVQVDESLFVCADDLTELEMDLFGPQENVRQENVRQCVTFRLGIYCLVPVFDETEMERFRQEEKEGDARAVELRKAIEDAWDKPFAIDLPAWAADLLDVENDPKIRITGKPGSGAWREREWY